MSFSLEGGLLIPPAEKILEIGYKRIMFSIVLNSGCLSRAIQLSLSKELFPSPSHPCFLMWLWTQIIRRVPGSSRLQSTISKLQKFTTHSLEAIKFKIKDPVLWSLVRVSSKPSKATIFLLCPYVIDFYCKVLVLPTGAETPCLSTPTF